MLEDRWNLEGKRTGERVYITPTELTSGKYKMAPKERMLFCTNSTGTPSYTVILPPAELAAGRDYVVRYTELVSGAITLTATGASIASALTLNTNEDGAMLRSDGFHWWAICNEVA